MLQAANVQFERAVDEFARWRAVPQEARAPAPGWWWGTAFELRDVGQPIPGAWCAILELPEGSTYADAAKVFLSSLADQTTLAYPGLFPGPVTAE